MVIMRAKTHSSQSLLARVVQNAASLIIGQGIAQAIVFLTWIYLARILLPEGFGKIGFAQSVVSFFFLLSDMGLALLGAREIAAGKDKTQHLRNIMSLRGTLGILTFLTLTLLFVTTTHLSEMARLVVLFGLAIIPYSLTPDWLFIGIQKMYLVSAINIIKNLVYLVLIVLFVHNSENLTLIPLFMFTGYVIGGFSCIYFVAQQHFGYLPTLILPFAEWKRLLSQSVPLLVYTVLTVSHGQIAAVLLGWLSKPEEVGLYLATWKVILLLSMLMFLYSDAIFPILSSPADKRLIVATSLKGLIMLSCVLAVLAAFASPWIIASVYGSAYTSGANLLRVLVLSLPLVATMAILSKALIARGNTGVVLRAQGFGLLIELVIELALIPRYGSYALAFAYIANMMVVVCCMVKDYTRLRSRGVES